MSIRGEFTQAQKRHGEQRTREGRSYDEGDVAPVRLVPPPSPLHPPSLFESGAWIARLGVRCGSLAPETKNP